VDAEIREAQRLLDKIVEGLAAKISAS